MIDFKDDISLMVLNVICVVIYGESYVFDDDEF